MNKDDLFSGIVIGFGAGVLVAYLMLEVFIGVIRPLDYCPPAFGNTELVLFEDGSWTCEED